MGLAYQIVDDILDVDGIVDVIGQSRAEEFAEGLFEKALLLIETLPSPQLALHAKEMIFRSA